MQKQMVDQELCVAAGMKIFGMITLPLLSAEPSNSQIAISSFPEDGAAVCGSSCDW
jgi:hypothetical protein